MATPVGTIIDNVRDRFEAETTTRWSDSAILSSIKDGIDELSEDTGFYELSYSLRIRDGRMYYDLRGIPGVSPLRVTAVFNTNTGAWLEPVDSRSLVSREEILRVEGEPRNYWISGGWWLGVYPRGDADSGYLRVYFSALAPHPQGSQDIIQDLPDELVPALEDYALYDLYAQDGETSKALLSYGLYKEKIKQLSRFVESRVTTARTGNIGGRR